jgi:hypothetical protein
VPKRKVNGLDLDSVERRFGPASWLGVSRRFDQVYWTFTRERMRAATIVANDRLSIPDTLLDELPGVILQSCRQVIELRIPDPQPSKHSAHAALIALAEMAGRDVFGLAALLSLPGARLGPDPDREHSPARVVELPGPTPVIFRPTEGSFAVITEASAPAGSAPAFVARIDDGGAIHGDLPPASIPISAAIELPHLGAGELVRDHDRVSFRWSGVVTDREILMAGARFLTAFGSGEQP